MKEFASFLAGLCLVVAVANQRVYAECSVSLQNKAKTCVSQFFQDVRENLHGNCSLMYQNLRLCINKAAEKCIEQTGKSGEERMRIRSKVGIFSVTEEFYCVKGMFDTNLFITRHKLTACKKKLFKRIRKCDMRFHRAFQKDKSSPSLCRKYQKSKKCVLKNLRKFCPRKSFAVKAVRRLYKDQFNPHCAQGVKLSNSRKELPSGDQPVRVGKCTVEEFYTNSKKCLVEFVRALQKDTQTICGKVFDRSFLPCLRGLYKTCTAKMLETKQSLQHKKSQLCSIGNSPPAFSSNICKKEYFRKLPACGAAFRSKFKRNRGDKTLCREYAKAKHCSKNVTRTLCKLGKQEEATLHYLYSGFNPFCTSSRDPKPRHSRNSSAGKQFRGTQKVISFSARTIGTWIILIIANTVVLNIVL